MEEKNWAQNQISLSKFQGVTIWIEVMHLKVMENILTKFYFEYALKADQLNIET